MSGRTCNVVDVGNVTCDDPPKPAAGCATGKTACYAVNPVGGSVLGPAAVCAGCCAGNSGYFLPTDCSTIVCSMSSECPAPYSACHQGQCMSQ
jgi:hypothetical protein